MVAIAGASPPICRANVYAPAALGTAPKTIAMSAANGSSPDATATSPITTGNTTILPAIDINVGTVAPIIARK